MAQTMIRKKSPEPLQSKENRGGPPNLSLSDKVNTPKLWIHHPEIEDLVHF